MVGDSGGDLMLIRRTYMENNCDHPQRAVKRTIRIFVGACLVVVSWKIHRVVKS